jgi:hypothetical protein
MYRTEPWRQRESTHEQVGVQTKPAQINLTLARLQGAKTGFNGGLSPSTVASLLAVTAPVLPLPLHRCPYRWYSGSGWLLCTLDEEVPQPPPCLGFCVQKYLLVGKN